MVINLSNTIKRITRKNPDIHNKSGTSKINKSIPNTKLQKKIIVNLISFT